MLAASSPVWADNYTVTFSKVGTAKMKVTTTQIHNAAIDDLWVVTPLGAKTYYYAGAHRAIPYGSQTEGFTFYSGSTKGGSGGGDKLHGDSYGGGIDIQFVNTTTIETTTFHINFPFDSGTITFSGDNVNGWSLGQIILNGVVYVGPGTGTTDPSGFTMDPAGHKTTQ